MAHFNKNAAVEDYRIRSERLCIPFKVAHNASAASIVYSSDLGGAVAWAGESNRTACDAIDPAANTNFTTPVAASGIVGILLYNLGTVQKVLGAATFNLSSGTAALTLVGASSTGVTANGNIAISMDSSLDFTATDLTGVLQVDYIIQKA